MYDIAKCKFILPHALGACALFLGVAVAADEPATTIDDTQTISSETGTIGRSANVEAELSVEFADFLGSEQRAADVVEGLRTGESFEPSGLDDPQSGAAPSETGGSLPLGEAPDTAFSIDPPTDSMGYGNVRLTMKLAQANFEKLGITQPTDEQLSAMLVGGEIDGVQLDGILTERAAGAGWGEIAKRYDLKVGQLMGKAANRASVTVDSGTDAAGAATSTHTDGYIPSGKTKFVSAGEVGRATAAKGRSHGRKANGYIPSGSSTSAATRANGVGNGGAAKGAVKKGGYIPSGGARAAGTGIVSGRGASLAGAAKAGQGPAKGQSKGYVPSSPGAASGIVSAGNIAAGAAVSAAGGHGRGIGGAKGRGKGK